MTSGDGFDLDRALARLAEAEAHARPAPGDALMARVLADAARIAGDGTGQGPDATGRRHAASPLPPSRGAARPAARPAAARAGRRARRSAALASALAACLAVGFLIGREAGPSMPSGAVDAFALADGDVLASAADPFGGGSDLPF